MGRTGKPQAVLMILPGIDVAMDDAIAGVGGRNVFHNYTTSLYVFTRKA
jgi:hypothetical protein